VLQAPAQNAVFNRQVMQKKNIPLGYRFSSDRYLNRIDREQAQKFVPMYIDKNGNLIGYTAPANDEDNPVVVIAKF
jgi:hypothetical protein